MRNGVLGLTIIKFHRILDAHLGKILSSRPRGPCNRNMQNKDLISNSFVAKRKSFKRKDRLPGSSEVMSFSAPQQAQWHF